MKNRVLQGFMLACFVLLLGGYGWKDTKEVAQQEVLEQEGTENVQEVAVSNRTSGTEETFQEPDKEDIINDVDSLNLNVEEKLNSIEETETLSLKEGAQEDEYYHLAFAHVDDYVNVRSKPSTDGAIVGKIYDGAVAEIVSEAGENLDWYEIVSGNVTGYIKAEFFLRGKEAAELMDKYIVLYGNVIADRLNVRSLPQKESEKLGVLEQGEKVRILEEGEEWHKIRYGETTEGYVIANYLSVREDFTYAKTLEELVEIKKRELEILRKNQMAEMAVNVPEQNKEEIATTEEANAIDMMQEEGLQEANGNQAAPDVVQEGLRQEIINYAMQYVGNRYISGGQSLANGTDCSGFTCYVYADFGYAISRTPQGQFTGSGRSIDYSEIQPGDIICYSSNGGKSCTHVALYIGDGQIVHSANSRKGVITQNADYDRIIGVKNVID